MNKKLFLAVLAIAVVFAFTTCGDLEVFEAINFVEPYITEQPESTAYIMGQVTAATIKPLKVLVDDWIDGDGELSYQWYTFANLAEYCAEDDNGAGNGRAIEGATEATYTPSLTPATDTTYYYYVEVTNVNPGATTDRKKGTIRSEVVIVSFNRPNDPRRPIIWNHPANSTQQFGKALKAMRTTAEISPETNTSGGLTGNPGAGLLSYQWYKASKLTTTIGTGADQAVAIDGAVYATYAPDAETVKAGRSNFYFVVVTNTNAGNTKTETSIPVCLEMDVGDLAAKPTITAQPRSQLFFLTDTIGALSVSANALDQGDLTYQWYYSTALPQVGRDRELAFTAISGATNATYTPAQLTSGTAGVGYYYVEVTNTQDLAKREKTAKVNSKVAAVRIAAAGSTANATITVNPDIKYNYVRGYGGMDIVWSNFFNVTAAETHTMFNPDWGLGYNILRIMIPPDNINLNTTMLDYVEGGRRPDYYNNVKIVNGYGGYVLASPWSPPKEWKSNNSINGGGHLLPAYYKQYANYLKAFAQLMYNKGAPIYAISIQNEPNYAAGYDGCEWEPEEMRDFFKQVGHFTNGVRGWGGGKETPVVLTVNGESANTPEINLKALQDPVSNAVIDLFARHNYGEQYKVLTLAERGGREMWMTEHNINSGNAAGYELDSTWPYIWRFLNDVDLTMRINEENAFVWWANKRFYSMLSEGAYKSGADGDVLPRGYALSHYAKYTIDTTRIELTMEGSPAGSTGSISYNVKTANTRDYMDNTSVRATAYINEAGNELSYVLWTPTDIDGNFGTNMGTIELKLPWEAEGGIGIRSNGTVYHAPEEIVLSTDRKSAFVSLPASTLVSLRFYKAED